MGKVLVTGAAGYIGSHTCVELLEGGYEVVAVDNLSNSSARAIDGVREIVGEEKSENLSFVKLDIRDRASLDRVFSENDVSSVIHFAGFKAVGESCREPLAYYDDNVGGTIALLETMQERGVKQIVFSSSATVYGDNETPYVETQRRGHTFSPYGWTKWVIEQMLCDLAASDLEWDIVLLRYFNPIGAHPSGLIGEDPKGIPNNLLPYVSQVAVGKRDQVHVFGGDYPTPDGTCRRDYLHVVDLARGHVAALGWMEGRHDVEAFNLGTGKPVSVLEIVHAFESACGHEIPYVIDPRRDGDLPEFWADATKAERELGWVAEMSLADMCADAWRWQSTHPDGYGQN